jgi:hypothetical protein
MPTLINMAMSAEEAKEYTEPSVSEAPEYPWGLCINLDDDQMEKLGLTGLPAVGAEIHIVAKATVTSTSSNARQDGESEASMSVQITDMAIANIDALKAGQNLESLYPSTFGSKK